MRQIMNLAKTKQEKIRIVFSLIIPGVILLTGCLVYLRSKGAGSELPVARDGYYEIDSPEDFYLFWDKVCDSDPCANGRLTEDVYLNKISDDMGWKEWEHLQQCRSVGDFYGVFDGNGHTIYGLYSNKGYGLVKRNKGIIRNLLIRDSVIYSNFTSSSSYKELAGDGGICKENYGEISNCDFGGKLYASEAADEQLSGICCRNLGIIEQCGFSGMIVGGAKYFDDKAAGICMKNLGEVNRCYNLVDLHDTSWISWPSRSFHVITDQGEKQCFALQDTGWDFQESGQTAFIKREQAEYIPSLIRGDFYELLVKDFKMDEKQEFQELLSDEIVLDLLMDLIVAKGEDWDQLNLEMEGAEGTARLILSDGKDKVVIRIYPVQQEAGWEEQEDFEGLWQQCAEILGEKDAGSFEHSSWQMLTGQEGEETVFGNFVSFWTDKGWEGFFLQKGQKLYQVESRGNQEESPEIYEILQRRLWEDKAPSVGISWKSEEIREAALVELEAVWERETEPAQGTDPEQSEDLKQSGDLEQSEGLKFWERTPSREELHALENLSINEVDRISSLEDLAKMPHLKSLSFIGEEFSYVNLDLEKDMVPELEELFIGDIRLNDLDFLEQWPQLNYLIVWNCKVEDISGIQYQKELTTALLAWNAIRSIWPLRSCKRLETVSLSNNQVEDLSVIASLSQLKELDVSNNEIISIEPLQWLGNLESLTCNDNQIEDFEPITGLTSLRELDICNNPGQNIGDLIFLPKLNFGNDLSFKKEEQRQEAQDILDSFYANEDLAADDMAQGDLNGDGIRDIAIADFSGDINNFEVYVFLGKADGTLRQLPAIKVPYPGDGWHFHGILITDGKLATQLGYGSFSGEGWYTSIYEYERGEMREKWKLEVSEDYEDYKSGFDFRITDMENQCEKHYMFVEDKLLLLKEDNGETSATEKEFSEKYTEFQKEIGQSLPEIPDLVSLPGYVWGIAYDPAVLPQAVLSEAAKKFLYNYQEIPVPGYTSEEIIHNYESLTGVELPKCFFIGFRKRDDEVTLLTYEGCGQSMEGSLVHTISIWHIEDGSWEWKEDITYDEKDRAFAAG